MDDLSYSKQIIRGKRILIVDDEKDVVDTLTLLLEDCKIDKAMSYEKAKEMLEEMNYDIAILDIMGVRGFDLLDIANNRKIPAIMLTAHALSQEALKKAAECGAAYYVSKEKMDSIAIYIADVIEGMEKGKNTWSKLFERLGKYYDERFGGPDWREKEKEFWKDKLNRIPNL